MSELPRGWVEATVGDTGQYINGFAFKPTNWESTGRPIIRIQNLTDPDKIPNRTNLRVPEDLVVRPGDLLVSWSATLDAFMWHGEEALLNQHIFRVVPDDRFVSCRYLYYLLKQLISEMLKTEHLHGSTMKHINRGPFMAHRAPIAPRAEQERIADEIDKQFTRLDAATAALKRVQANLKRYRASVLKAACEGRLVPTEAELARKEGRDYEPADQLLQRILRERRARWEAETLAKMLSSGEPPKDDRWKQKYKEAAAPDTTNLPELPKGWCWATLGQLTSLITSGSRGWGDRYSESGPIFIRAQDIKTDSLILQDVAHVQLSDGTEGTRTRIQRSDLLITITGANVTKAAVVGLQLDEAYVSQHVGLVRPVLSETADQIYGWMVSPMQGRAELLRLAYGAGKPGLNLDNLRELCIPLPPAAEQQRIQAELSRIISSVTPLQLGIDAAHRHSSSLRTSILKTAFSGKLAQQDPADEPAASLLERIRMDRRDAMAGKVPQQPRPASDLVPVG